MIPTEQITEERLKSWKHKLEQGHATPIVLVGVGHDHKRGELVVCLPEGVDDDLLIGSLLFVLEQIRPGIIPKQHGQSRRVP